MTWLVRHKFENIWSKEWEYFMESVWEDSDDRLISRIAYNVLKSEVYKSLDDESKQKYYNYSHNISDQNSTLTGPVLTKRGDAVGYLYHLSFFVHGKKHNLDAFLCNKVPNYDGAITAAYNTDDNTLYLPFLVEKLDCVAIKKIDDLPFTMAHEMQHYIDFIRSDRDSTAFDQIPDPNKNADGYYNNEREFMAYKQELIEFLFESILKEKKPEEYIAIIKNFSDAQFVKNYLGRVFSNDYPKPRNDPMSTEIADLSSFYGRLEDENKARVIKDVSEFFDKVLRQKMESTDKNIKDILHKEHFKIFRSI